MTSIAEVVDAWIEVAQEEVSEGRLALNHCILGSRTLLEVFKRVDIEADWLTVEALAANRVGMMQILLKRPVKSWPPEAWSVGVSMQSPGGGYPGHVVIVAQEDGDQFLVDSSSGQFARPQYGILPPPAMVLQLPDRWEPNPELWLRHTTPEWELSWRPEPRLGLRHRAAKDWRKGRHAFVDRVLARV